MHTYCADLRNRYAEGSWDMFNRLLEETAPLNGTLLLLLHYSFLKM
jgi:hypothetical protein